MNQELRNKNLKTLGASGIFEEGQAKRQSGFDDLADASQSIFKKILLATLIASCFIILTSAPSAYAQEFSAGVNPTILEIKAQSPSLVRAPITLENSSAQSTTFNIYLRPFKASPSLNGDPNYDPKLVEEYSDFFNNVAIFDGNEPVTEIIMGAKEKKEFELRVNLESGSEPRDYYFTVVFLSQPEISEPITSQSNLRGGIGTNVLLSVGEHASPQGRISSFNFPKFILKGPVEFDLELANHSDFFIASHGNIIIKNMFGQAVGNLEFGPTFILANSNRLMSNTNNETGSKLVWDEKFPLGIYKADLSVALSENGPLLRESRTFFALPLKVIVVILAIIIIGIWLIRKVKKKSEES